MRGCASLLRVIFSLQTVDVERNENGCLSFGVLNHIRNYSSLQTVDVENNENGRLSFGGFESSKD